MREGAATGAHHPGGASAACAFAPSYSYVVVHTRFVHRASGEKTVAPPTMTPSAQSFLLYTMHASTRTHTVRSRRHISSYRDPLLHARSPPAAARLPQRERARPSNLLPTLRGMLTPLFPSLPFVPRSTQHPQETAHGQIPSTSLPAKPSTALAPLPHAGCRKPDPRGIMQETPQRRRERACSPRGGAVRATLALPQLLVLWDCVGVCARRRCVVWRCVCDVLRVGVCEWCVYGGGGSRGRATR